VHVLFHFVLILLSIVNDLLFIVIVVYLFLPLPLSPQITYLGRVWDQHRRSVVMDVLRQRSLTLEREQL
jgi:hypothetical protein